MALMKKRVQDLKLKYWVKHFFGSFVMLNYCMDCGKRNHSKYSYVNENGDNEICLKCECGTRWHMADHVAQ